MVMTGGARRAHGGWRAGVWALTLGMLGGCQGKSCSPTEPVAEQGAGVAPGEAPGEPAAPVEEAKPLTAEDLKPVIKAAGAQGVAPQKVVIAFSTDIFTEKLRDVYESDPMIDPWPGTVVVVDPAIPGRTFVTSTSTLAWVPDEEMTPGQVYTLSLASVGLADRTLEAPAGGGWATSIEAPRFGLADLGVESLEIEKERLSLLVTYSYAVQAEDVAKAARFTVNGAPIKAKIERTQRPWIVRAILTGAPVVTAGSVVELNVAAGVPRANDRSLGAPSDKRSLTIEVGEPIQILASNRRESPTGHYVDVVCKDDAAQGEERWYWDPVDYQSYTISSRCQLREESAAEHIHFEPAVPFYTTPSEAGFRIFGEFKRGTYHLRMDAGARSIDGGLLTSVYETDLVVPARQARVSFAAKGRYLPRDAWANLPIRHLNAPSVHLTIRHIPPENLVFWMSGSEETADQRTSDIVLEKDLALSGPEDEEVTTWVDVASLLPKPERGVYELRVVYGESSDSARLLLTDMNLLAKASAPAPGKAWSSSIDVWSVDMHALAPVGGVRVKAVRPSGHAMGTCTTDGDGHCRLELPTTDVDQTPPFALIAAHDDDLTYLKFDELKTSTDDAQVQGEPFLSKKPYLASLWMDRGVYRPGETAHVAAVLRDERFVAPQAEMPVILTVQDPRGRLLKKVVATPNKAGMLALDIPFADYADTGRYEVDLSVAGQSAGKITFNVEEFVPERMKVEAKAAQPAYLTRDGVEIDLSAVYLFGGKADGNAVEVSCYLQPAAFKPTQNAQLEYGTWRAGDPNARRVTLGQLQASLDAEGKARVTCPAPEEGASFYGPAEVVADVAVFESGSGRTTRADARVPVHPERYYIGLTTAATKAEPGKEITVEGLIVDWEGRPVKDAVKELDVTFARLEAEYGWYWWDEGGEESFERRLRQVPEGRTRVTVDGGKFRIQFTPKSPSDGFLVRVGAGAARTELKLEGGGGYWWYGESQVDQTPRPLKPTALALKVEGKATVGKPLTVRFDVPFRGRVLMTAETHETLTSRWLDVQPGPVEWTYTPSAFTPNVYISALALKDPHIESAEAFRPDRAFGVVSVPVEPTGFSVDVKLTTPKEIRPHSTLEVGVNAAGAGGGWVTVAAVDEGILSLTRFKDPNPHTDLFARRALGVSTFETIGWSLLLPPGGPSSRTGGDEGGDLGRVQPVKPVALWSGLVQLDAQGKATVKFEVPQYRGSLRVMAVAADGKLTGAASTSVTVRDPLVLQTTLPRFLVQGDEVQIPVFVTNLSGKKQTVTLALQAENLPLAGVSEVLDPLPPLQLLGARDGRLELADGQAGTVVFQARATRAVGAARLKVEARAGDLVSYESLEVPFAPQGPTVRRAQRIELKAGDNQVSQVLTGWVPTTERSTLWVTSNPYGEAFDHLSYLVRYPYGCIEQTTSSTRPLLYVSKLLYNVAPDLVAQSSVEKMVQAGIDRLVSMKTASGGFAYWPGGVEPTRWGTAYATHLLLDAQKAGFAVPSTAVDDAIAWMEQDLNAGGGSYSDWGGYGEAEPYMQFVLALAGKGRKARLQQLIDERAGAKRGERAEQLYMLQAGLYLAGDRRHEAALKNPDLSDLDPKRDNSWTYYSDRRRRGFVLATFVDLFGPDPAGQPLAELVARSLSGHASAWYATQELVWGITGLGKWVDNIGGAFSPPELLVKGKAREAQPVPEKSKTSDRTWSLARASEYGDIVVRMKPFEAKKVYLMVSSEGIRDGEPWELGGQGLSIDRTYRTLTGEELGQGDLALGDLVYVELTVSNQTNTEVQNLALVDRFPAGWEIENPRLGRGGSVEWLDEETVWAADYMNLRDDRMEVFGRLGPNESRKVVYALRAVTAGSFTVPPVSVEAMYDPSIWARAPGGRVSVSGPWADFLL